VRRIDGTNVSIPRGDPSDCDDLTQSFGFVHRTKILEASMPKNYRLVVRRSMRCGNARAGMSDIKTKRAARESAQSEAALPPAETAPAVPPVTALPEPLAAPPSAKSAPAADIAAPDDMLAYGRQSWAALAEAQAATARGFEALVGEMTNFTRSEMAAAANTATAMLGVKTFAEAVEVNLGFARRSFDAVIGSAARLSEIGAKAAAETSRPILSRFG
jgi:hypothetical protein